ncbi:Co2+/Mg2+ efflux protein ApaG [Pedobacter yulinensis]|uniref:Co2+/Mg2+ efflux protein ApaG n=1 Tax=Pedobacter yulinensis TaxID=2126353 RepID=A0A2T3HRL3_9SPHI|nr:Co2+/Mg2+ efflux protein ApaG [Pedobacter yulinensis]PST85056.1 Co2+/Mg2+ efflux protein ApaG [Pedobacter yulinensis]
MVTLTTAGVKVSVETVYQPEYSNPANEHFMFAYRIEIENCTAYPIQLLRRKWFIFDSNREKRTVEGEGVVGIQPVIQPGQVHAYVSGSNLKTDMGFMEGEYEMIRTLDEHAFQVDIPKFNLIAPYRLN